MALDSFYTSALLVTLMNGALHSSESSVLTRAMRRKIPEDGILLVCNLIPGYFYISVQFR
jgi:hypothetical protein